MSSRVLESFFDVGHDLVEIHALPLEHGVVGAREGLGHDAVRANLDLADFLEDFAGDHRGMGGCRLLIADWTWARCNA